MQAQKLCAFGLVAACGMASLASAAISFGPGSSVPAVQRPSGAAIADFTGDGNADLAVTVDTPNRLLVYPGNGTGTFGAPLSTPLSSGAGDVAAADFDRDGDMDIAICLQNSNTLRVYLNNGTGAFTLSATITTGTEPRNVIAGDVNGDLRPDLVLSNRESNNITVAINGTGGWTSSNIAAGAEPRGVSLGDKDGDGDLDLVVGNHDSRNLTVFTNGGAGNFVASQTLAVNPTFRPDGVAFVQVAGSALPEVAAVISDDTAGSFVALYVNNAGTIAAGAMNYTTNGVNSGSVVVADFDVDGRLDVVVNNEDSNNISVLAGTGSGFGAPLVLAAGTHPTALAVGRINAGVLPDIAVPNRDSNNVSIFLNAGTPPGPVCDSIDFNNDGGIFDPQDINAFLSVYSEGSCIPATATCNDIDFNNDTSVFDPQDINAFLSVYSEGPCF